MAKTDEARISGMAKLFEAQAECLEKLRAIHDEIEVLLNGGDGIGPKLKTAIAVFDGAWSTRYAGGRSGSYAWRRPQDMAQLKRLIKVLGIEELTARMANYLKSDEPFYVKNRHTFGLFVSSVNSWAGAPGPIDEDGAPAVSDCTHVPRCRTDVAHTSRKMLELRG